MTFLNPAILFGLIAASIPIVLHFLNLRKLKRVEFSTLVFLKELQKTKIKRIKLKQWLLLLLRIAIIIFLVLAFARPTIKNISIGNSSTAKTTAVIIIDNTFSMSIVTGNGSYLNHAKQIAKKLLSNFQDGDEIVLLGVGNLSHEMAQPTTNNRQLTKQIDELEISVVSKTLNQSIIKAAQVLYRSNNYNKEIYLLTDMQKGSIYNSSSELSNLSSIFNNNVRLYLIDLSDKDPVNLGIEAIKPNNQIFEKGKTVSFDVTVKNYSKQSVSNSVASLFVNEKRSAQQSVNLVAGESKTIPFETTILDTGLVEIYAGLEDDDILPDNKRFFSVYVPDKISVLILTDNRDDAKFVKYAIDDPTKQKVKITENSLSQVSSLNYKNYDVVIVIGSERTADWNTLINFTEAGGGLILIPGSLSTLLNFQKLCNALKISFPVSSVGKINSQDSPALFDKINYQEPFFADLFENNKQQQIESPEIYYYFKVVPGGNGKNIISMFDGSSFLSEYKRGSGKVFLFNSSLNLGWNNFPLKGFFAPLINRLLLYSSSNVKEQNTYYAGQNIIADISNHSISQIKVETPGGENEYVNSDSLTNQNYFNYTKTDETGTYNFFSSNKLLDYISVNHDPKESITDKANYSEFEDYLKQISFEGKAYSLSPGDDFTKVIYQSRFGTELWKYFLIAVLILAIIESLVARNTRKDLSSIHKPESRIKND